MTGPLDPGAPILWGRDYNFFQKISVSTVGTFNYDSDVIITFTTQGFQFLNLGSGGTNVVEFSFNGNTVHGELNPSNATAGLTFDNRVASKIWFRVQAGSTGPVTVSVNAWSIP
jgi:hypothetical protein